MRNRVREVITNPLEPSEDSSISLTYKVTLMLTESESSFILFSREWDNESVDWEVGWRQKLAMVAKIEARRYLRDRGGEFRILSIGSGIFLG